MISLAVLLFVADATATATASADARFSLSAGARVFTVAGAPTAAKGSAAAGAVATAAVLDQITRVAAAPDGGFVLMSPYYNTLVRVDVGGRLQPLLDGRARYGYSGDGGPASRARVSELSDVAVAADGSVYVADGGNCNVRRIAPDGLIFTVAGQRRELNPSACRDRGDNGPGERSELCSVHSLAVTPRRSLLINTCQAIRELGPDGIIRRIAGTNRSLERQPRDGERALTAPLESNLRIAALAGGETVIGGLAERVWLVDGRGFLRVIRQAPRSPNTEVLGLPDGSLLIAPEYDGRLLRRWPDGRIEQLLRGRWSRSMAGAHDGDAGPLSQAPLSPFDMDVTADGGLLLAEGLDHIRYVAPPQPKRLAVGITRETLSSRLPIEVSIETTLPASATVELRVGGRRVETQTREIAPGRSTFTLANARSGALHVVTVHAASASSADAPPQVTSDQIGVIPGATLPMRVIRRVEADEAALLESIGGGRRTIRCKRFAPRRIDCAEIAHGTCQGARSYIIGRDGVLTVRTYAKRHGCRLQPRPKLAPTPRAVTLPT